ncbi:vesicle transport protein USE1-like [Oppia nitens]|uniref:vesicle transport protein USE1-like n=1 Tax=Oppia nitens TaxID=1686743 RepID=UPI0023DBE4A8|nr:vesicle transport protein USE1-like [Oppia nitens]
MTVKSREEIDFRRLLSKCEQLVEKHMKDNINTNNGNNNWRLERYIHALNERLNELKELNACPVNENNLSNYKKKVSFFNSLLETQLMNHSNNNNNSTDQQLIKTEIMSPISVTPVDGGIRSDKTKEIHLNLKSRLENDVRTELFGNKESSIQMRKRVANDDTTNSSVDSDAILRFHQSVQEKVAQEMITLVHNLKQNCSLSNEIIKKDTESLEKSSSLAQRNTDNLKGNTVKISEYVRRSCQYWLWIMLFIVVFTFLWIVVFIRLFPKKYN